MRLIDADALIETMEKAEEDYENMGSIPNWFTALRIIKEQPTAYDVEKVLEQLDKVECHIIGEHYFEDGISKAIDIVKVGGIE